MSDPIDWDDPDAVVGTVTVRASDDTHTLEAAGVPIHVRDLDPSIVKQMRAAQDLAKALEWTQRNSLKVLSGTSVRDYDEQDAFATRALAAWKEAGGR